MEVFISHETMVNEMFARFIDCSLVISSRGKVFWKFDEQNLHLVFLDINKYSC